MFKLQLEKTYQLVAEFVRDKGKPFQIIYDCPMVTDIVRALEER